MPCRGNCLKFATDKQTGNLGYHGRKRCNACAVYIPSDYNICPCCNGKLKTKPRKRRYG